VHVIGVYHTLAQDAKARQSSLTTMARQAVTSADALLHLVAFYISLLLVIAVI
jgi:hypothetical protein